VTCPAGRSERKASNHARIRSSAASPRDARVGHRLAVRQLRLLARAALELLVALDQVALHHHAHDVPAVRMGSVAQLLDHALHHLQLVAMYFYETATTSYGGAYAPALALQPVLTNEQTDESCFGLKEMVLCEHLNLRPCWILTDRQV